MPTMGGAPDEVVERQRRLDALLDERDGLLALLDRVPGEAHVAALERAHADLRRTGRLVDELLHLARADAAGGPGAGPLGAPERARVYLDDLVGDALAGDVGGRAVDRLVEPRCPRSPERRRRQHAERSRRLRRRVR